MAAGHPVLGTEVVEIDPAGFFRVLCQSRQVIFGQLAGKGFDDDIGDVCRRNIRKILCPVPDDDLAYGLCGAFRVEFRAHRLKTLQIVDPQANTSLMFGGKLAGQTPAHTDVAVVVDDVAENVPADIAVSGVHDFGALKVGDCRQVWQDSPR